MKYILMICSLILILSCGSKPKGPFQPYPKNDAPDYSNPDHWAALPSRLDNADRAPGGLQDQQNEADVDVFYLHPTSYFGDRSYKRWNAAISNEEVNKSVDENAILYQATAFNKAGKVYAPRYRQTHLHAYYLDDKDKMQKIFDVAYEDVKNAFAYFLKNYNGNRPFIIASHSQGTTHAARLIEEFIDGKPLQDRLVAAYLIGIPVDLDQYESIKACENETQTGCLIGWRTWKDGATPALLKKEEGINVLITNPLSWTTSTELVPAEENKGSVYLDFEAEPSVGMQSAQIYKSILYTNKPKFPGSALMTTKNFHRGDINIYYVNIRENAAIRAAVFMNKM